MSLEPCDCLLPSRELAHLLTAAAGTSTSTSDSNGISGANLRPDGRRPEESRPIKARVFDCGEVELSIGKTKLLAITTGNIIVPSSDRPNQGKIIFQVSYGPSDSSSNNNLQDQATCLSQKLDRLLRGSHALSDEALCVVAGEKVWHLNVLIRILTDDGGVNDLAALAAIVSLSTFRKSGGGDPGNSNSNDSEELSLSESPTANIDDNSLHSNTGSTEEALIALHHVPIPVTLTMFPSISRSSTGNFSDNVDGGLLSRSTIFLDLSSIEEKRKKNGGMQGQLCLSVNQKGELCGCDIMGLGMEGIRPIELFQVLLPLAAKRAAEIQEQLGSLLKVIEEDREMRRTKRKRPIHNEEEEEEEENKIESSHDSKKKRRIQRLGDGSGFFEYELL